WSRDYSQFSGGWLWRTAPWAACCGPYRSTRQGLPSRSGRWRERFSSNRCRPILVRRGGGAVVKQQLPFGELDSFRQILILRTGRRFAEAGEGGGVPAGRCAIAEKFRFVPEQWINRMRWNAVKPVARVADIAFHAMQDGVPVHALRIIQILSNLVSFVQTGEIEIEAGEGCLRIACSGEKLTGLCSCQLGTDGFIGTAAREEVHGAHSAPGLAGRQDAGDL